MSEAVRKIQGFAWRQLQRLRVIKPSTDSVEPQSSIKKPLKMGPSVEIQLQRLGVKTTKDFELGRDTEGVKPTPFSRELQGILNGDGLHINRPESALPPTTNNEEDDSKV